MTLVVVALYLAAVLAIGLASRRVLAGTGEDFFAASRTIGTFVLLMSLFGTHMTAFSLLGASGEAYRVGVGVFGLMASSSALVVPAVFLFVGVPLWRWGRRLGFLTQVELFRERYRSEALALLLLAFVVVLLVPYLLIGVMGGGITLEQISGGDVPRWAGSLLIALVVVLYVTAGGVRGAAWVNTFQTLVFMTLGAVTFALVVGRLGGLGEALARVDPSLLVHGERIGGWKLATYALVPLSVGMFPHIFMHWLTAQSAAAFRLPVIAYPLCLVVVWVPSVLLGVLGTVDVPGLDGPAANAVLIVLIDLHAPDLLAGFLAAGVFAAVMSSLDSQVLALSNLLTRDLVRRHGLAAGRGERAAVWAGRFGVVVLMAAIYLLSLVVERSIFRLGIWSFSGFAALFPLVVAALYWRRSTRWGAIASVVTAAALWAGFLARGWAEPDYTVGGTGVMPVAVMVAGAAGALWLVSLMTRPPPGEVVERFFGRG